MSPFIDFLPRTRSNELSRYQVRDELCAAELFADPFDPRQRQVLGLACVREWLALAEEELDDIEAPETLQSGVPADDDLGALELPAVSELRSDGCLEFKCGRHQLALVVVSRREGVNEPVVYRVLNAVIAKRPSAICCVYLRVTNGGTVQGLLEGWVDREHLAKRKPQGDVEIVETDLRPMHELQDLLRAAPVIVPSRSRDLASLRRSAVPLALAATAAFFYVLGSIQQTTPPGIVPSGRITATVVEANIARPEQVQRRGGSGTIPVFRSGDKYEVEFRIVSPRRFGWLFQADSRANRLLDRAEPQAEGTQICRFQGRFDQNVGFEFFILVLSDDNVAKLDQKDEKWLMAEDLRQLQTLAGERDLEKAVELICRALERAGWTGGPADLRFEVVDHRR
jgi:hypothetical protein